MGRKNFYINNCLFDAKFFEFEKFTIVTFFFSSIQPQHTVNGNAQHAQSCNFQKNDVYKTELFNFFFASI
jgi:hypothetical protein